MQNNLPPILDVCCGSKSFWFDKNDDRVIFLDVRSETVVTDTRPGRKAYVVSPDMIGDFTNINFPDCSFFMVVFDPPHLVNISSKSWLAKKYGSLGDNWQSVIAKGFQECFRVLKPGGFLIFKWAEAHISLTEILSLTDVKPLFGNQSGKTSKTHWVTFTKPNKACTRHGQVAPQFENFE